jgi:hypothetical protein
MPKPGHAEYMKRWRATTGPRKIRAARLEGVAEGVQRCIALMEKLYGEQSVTGFAAASAIRKTLLTQFPLNTIPVANLLPQAPLR